MNIKQLREHKNLTQGELSEQTGIPRYRIAKWEQGKGAPKAEDFKILEKFFSCSREEVPRETIAEHATARDQAEAEVLRQPLERSIENLTENQLRNTAIIERLVSLLEMQISSGKHTSLPVVPLGPGISPDPAAGGEKLSGNNLKAGR